MNVILLSIISLSSLPIMVNAQSTNDTLVVDKGYSYYVATTKYDDLNAWVSAPEYLIRRASDGALVYCIQAHVHLQDNSNVIGYDNTTDKINMANMTLDQIEKIELISYYGYGYANHTSLDWYAATQLLIWEITDPVSTPYPIEAGDSSLTRSSKYDAMMNEIRNLVASHGRTVSFSGNEITIKNGETKRITDTNGVLSKYFEVESNDSLNISIDGNDLVITANKGFEGQVSLTAKTNSNVPLIYDGGNQLCLSRGDPTFISGRIKINVQVEVEIEKVFGNSNSGIYKPEKDSIFELYNTDTNEFITTLTTDSNGWVNIYLGFGNYRLHQIKGTDTYKFIDDYYFTIDSSSVKEKVYLKNEKIKSDIVITKTDETSTTYLPNTEVEIYKVDKDKSTLVYSGITDTTGRIILKNFEYGDYYLIEKKAPEGYELSTDKMYFSITEDGKVITLNMKNKKIITVPDTKVEFFDVLSTLAWVFIIGGTGYLVYDKIKKNKK